MVFIYILLTIILISIILIFSKIQIQINNFKFKSVTKRHINKDYEIIIKLYILEIIPILKINITKTKLEKLKIKEKIKDLDIKLIQNKKQFDKKTLDAIKQLNIEIKNIELFAEIGTENASLTAIIVPAISTIIAIILHKKVKKFENQIFSINPVYANQNLININISGIFAIKIKNIMNIIYKLNKEQKREKKQRNNSFLKRKTLADIEIL